MNINREKLTPTVSTFILFLSTECSDSAWPVFDRVFDCRFIAASVSSMADDPIIVPDIPSTVPSVSRIPIDTAVLPLERSSKCEAILDVDALLMVPSKCPADNDVAISSDCAVCSFVAVEGSVWK